MENTTSPSRARFGNLSAKSKNFFAAVKSNLSIYSITRFIKRSAYLPLIIVVVLISVLAFFGIKGVFESTSGQSKDSRVSINKPLAQQTLNREFSFPLKDAKGKEVSKLAYEIQSAELRSEIIVKGQKATAIKGRAFLVINLKITNNYNQAISINARDYLRIIVDGSTEKLAPDIHNDPVEVQAISTKSTRVGVAVDDTAKNIVLQVGEIDGKKDSITLDLK